MTVGLRIFRCRSAEKSGYLDGFIDWHSHILPDVDDGVRTVEEALEILAEYDCLGVAEVWLTPHVMEDMPNTTEALRERFGELCAAWTGRVKLRLAAEYMLDNLFEERLAAGDLLPLGTRGDRLLVETSFFNPPADMHGKLERIRSKGYHPVLAHPERYMYMEHNGYRSLRAAGVEFQLNLPSLRGMYGTAVKRKAKRLLQTGMYRYSGSDMHRKAGLETLTQLPVIDKLPTHG